MDSIQNINHIFFITEKNYTTPSQNENISIQKYFDISKNRLLSFTIQNNELFIILNQSTFGSAFFGNIVLTEPKYFIIKKFCPIYILIQIIYNSQTDGENKEKNKDKNSSSNEYIDTSAIIQKYEDKLKELKDKNDLFNNNYESIFKSSMNFVKYIFDKYSNNIELIGETKELSNDSDKDKKICVKICESKVFNYLNSRVNLNSLENKEIEESGIKDQNEKDILIKRKIYEKITILEPFLPGDLFRNYLKYKHIDFLNDDEISMVSNESNKNHNKRKRKEEKKQVKKKKEISKNQRSMNDFFKQK
jgi:hypothetical protein